ncbi:MAG TPA: methylmalonyl Co-A mutase-associated GTPase MeaB [Planctomycetes bacterium]|nr:methylmalonyl Co-A mutase-associated GTPase MeaB [Planctomycetota bacterium]
MRSEEVLEGVRARDQRSLGRALSLVEAGEGEEILDGLADLAGQGARLGVTGSPGAGKSTLLSSLVGYWRGLGETVGVLAVDPSSPFSGGALLGDRIRMQEHSLDEGVFIRSVASRGAVGGLAEAAIEMVDVLEAFGFDRLVVETVGTGQAEIDVMEACDLVLVVLQPGAGDGIQAMKAGLLEIADLLVLNKADLEGSARLESELREMLELREEGVGRAPEVYRVSAKTGEGVQELAEGIDRRLRRLEDEGVLEERRARRRREAVKRLVRSSLEKRLDALIEAHAPKLGEGSPREGARWVLGTLLCPPSGSDARAGLPAEEEM